MADMFEWVKRSNASALRLPGVSLLCILNIEILTCYLDVINVKFIGLFSLLVWDTSPSIYLTQTGSLNLSKTLLEAVEDVKAADLLCSCLAAWHPKGLNTALAINRRNF